MDHVDRSAPMPWQAGPFVGFIAAACCLILTVLSFVAVHVASGSPVNWAHLKFAVSPGISFGALGVLPTALVTSFAPVKYRIGGASLCVFAWVIGVTFLWMLWGNAIADV